MRTSIPSAARHSKLARITRPFSVVASTPDFEDVLSHILSQLPINDAIRTSVLSRKWKHIWHGHTKVTFNWSTMRKHYFNTGCGYGSLSDTEFITRVDAVLHQHCGRGIELMEIKFGLHKKHAEHIDRWVDFAIAAKAKKLTVDLFGGPKFLLSRKLLHAHLPREEPREEPYNIPSRLFYCDIGSYLQCLELTSVALQLPADFKGFLNLKNLTLADVAVTDEDVHRMLLRCNLLEFFDISYCTMVTRIRICHPLSQFKHFLVSSCPLLQVIELNCSPMTLEYTGNVVPIKFASTSRLTSVRIKLLSHIAPLYYIATGFPATLPSLETLTLQCSAQCERTILRDRPFIFTYLRHLRLELVLHGHKKRKTDVLDYAYLLEIAPFLEKSELHMLMDCHHQPYHKEDGDLRIHLPQKQHTHLKFVRISGFFGHKDQVELAVHILHCSVVLEKMEITPRIEIAQCDSLYERTAYMDGHRVATEFVCKADHRNVVDVKRASIFTGPLD